MSLGCGGSGSHAQGPRALAPCGSARRGAARFVRHSPLVAAVDEHVTLLEERGEVGDDLVDGRAGGHEEHELPRLGERVHELLGILVALQVADLVAELRLGAGDGGVDLVVGAVVDRDGEAVLRDVEREVLRERTRGERVSTLGGSCGRNEECLNVAARRGFWRRATFESGRCRPGKREGRTWPITPRPKSPKSAMVEVWFMREVCRQAERRQAAAQKKDGR